MNALPVTRLFPGALSLRSVINSDEKAPRKALLEPETKVSSRRTTLVLPSLELARAVDIAPSDETAFAIAESGSGCGCLKIEARIAGARGARSFVDVSTLTGAMDRKIY